MLKLAKEEFLDLQLYRNNLAGTCSARGSCVFAAPFGLCCHLGSAAAMSDNPNAPQSGIISRKEQLDPETRARFEAWQRREARAHPLYTRTSEAYGSVPEGEARPLVPPAHAKPSSSKLGVLPVTKDTERRTTLITSLRVRTS